MAGLLRATVAREGLQGRVRMLGAVPSESVRDVLASPQTDCSSATCYVVRSHAPNHTRRFAHVRWGCA